MEEAKVLYPQLGLLANLGLVGSGKFIKAVHRAVGGGKPGPDGMGAVLQVGLTKFDQNLCNMFDVNGG
jgi:hypothetical protein